MGVGDVGQGCQRPAGRGLAGPSSVRASSGSRRARRAADRRTRRGRSRSSASVDPSDGGAARKPADAARARAGGRVPAVRSPTTGARARTGAGADPADQLAARQRAQYRPRDDPRAGHRLAGDPRTTAAAPISARPPSRSADLGGRPAASGSDRVVGGDAATAPARGRSARSATPIERQPGSAAQAAAPARRRADRRGCRRRTRGARRASVRRSCAVRAQRLDQRVEADETVDDRRSPGGSRVSAAIERPAPRRSPPACR